MPRLGYKPRRPAGQSRSMSPARRAGNRFPRKAARVFESGVVDRTKFSWGTGGGSMDALIYQYLTVLRRRSRYLCHNNEYARNFLRMARHNLIGPSGVKFQSKAVNGAGQLDTADNARVEAAWRKQSKRQNYMANARFNRAIAEGVMTDYLIRDGELLIEKVEGFGRNGTGFTLRMYDPDRLDIRLNKARNPATGLRVVMGVALDDDDRPVEYHVLRQHPEGNFFQHDTAGWNQYRVIPAENMIHCFIPMSAEQHRGVPWLFASIQSLRDVGAYREAAIVAARVGAAKMGFFRSPEGDSFEGDGEDEEGNVVMHATPGSFAQVTSDTEFESWDPTYPHEQFGDFNKEMLRGVAAGLGAAHHNLTGDLEGVNFSSSRMGQFTEREMWMTLQNFFIDSINQDIYEDWLAYSLMSGALAPIPPARFDKFADPKWQGRRWQPIQPVEHAQAVGMAHAMGTKSISSIIRDHGDDPDEVWSEYESDKKAMDKYGIQVHIINAFKPQEQSGAGNDQANT